ncbi:MAG: Pre-rRNA-processing protein ipi3 [Piccolia ochrophora]|nr:MAG: Pre-rRNA-processing protein ipi3 [Piccolia ochrophora]
MLSEGYIAATLAAEKATNSSVSRDSSICIYEFQPSQSLKSSFKKSSTSPECLAASSTHVFAGQAEKAVVHVYSRETGHQEALVPFPDRIRSVVFTGDDGGVGVLALGTEGGRLILWEVCTGRQVSTHQSHLQPVTTLAADPTSNFLLSGSSDSIIHVWSLANLLSFSAPPATDASTPRVSPVRTLSNHRAAITTIRIGHSHFPTNIAVSASEDSTCIIWDYHAGHRLRTVLLPSPALSLALDPCDRAFYAGFADGSVQLVDLYHPSTGTTHPLYDPTLQSHPIQPPTSAHWPAPTATIGAAHALTVSYDGTALISGHASGKIGHWDIGARKFRAELNDLSTAVTNVTMLPPTGFPNAVSPRLTAHQIVKPRYESGLSSTEASSAIPANYTLTAQFTSDLTSEATPFSTALHHSSLPADLLPHSLNELMASRTSGAGAVGGGDGETAKQLTTLRARQREMVGKMTSMREELSVWKRAEKERIRKRYERRRRRRGEESSLNEESSEEWSEEDEVMNEASAGDGR